MESCGQDDSVGPTAYSGDTVCREPDDAVIRRTVDTAIKAGIAGIA